jgi:beta-N-acetylhexosaminidase
MTTHLIVERFENMPLTVSPAAIDCIRNEIGFDGLIMTDYLLMAVPQSSGHLLPSAFLPFGGNDIALICNDEKTQRECIFEFGDALSRILPLWRHTKRQWRGLISF